MRLALNFLLDVPELGNPPKTSMEVPPGDTVADLRRTLASTFPSLVDWAEFLVVTVDGKLVDDDFGLSDGQTVMLLLPRAGG